MSTELSKELHTLNPSARVELFELDARPAGDDSVLYFHNGTLGITSPITFMGITYGPMAIQATGFETTSSGEPPRPTLSISNLAGFLSALVLKTGDLVGAKFTRRVTFARFLDNSRFAAPVIASEDIFYIEQKTRENRLGVEFELGTPLDLDGITYPLRTVTSGYCPAVYRGAGCEFSRPLAVATETHTLFEGAANFRGLWSSTASYVKDESVQWTTGGFVCTFVCTVNGPITGDANDPSHTASWKQVQRYRGIYDAEVSNYVKNDVVTRQLSGQLVLAIVIWTGASVPPGQAPPNSVFWKTDACAKYLRACQARWDPTNQNLPLPYGGFPGTISMPDV